MRQLLFIKLLSLLLLTSQVAYAIDITSFSIVKEELTTEKGESAKWQNLLLFSGSTSNIKLARTLRRDTGQFIQGYTDGGLDAKTIKVKQLDKNVILITWSTFSQREPEYDYDGLLILKVANENVKEVLRHNYSSYWYQGGCTNYKKKLNVSFSENELELQLLNHQEECSNNPIPLGIKSAGPEPALYSKKIDETSIWKYQLTNESLQFITGQMITDIGPAKFNLIDIASYYGTSVEALKTLNSNLGEDSVVTGRLVVNGNLKKLKADQYDGLYGIHGR